MARLVRAAAWWLLLLGLLMAGWWCGRDYIERHRQDVPWTPLRLDDPLGYFTVRKVTALADDPAQCRALLRQAQSADEPAPPRADGAECGYTNGIRLLAAEEEARPVPGALVTSCPVAAAMTVFERQVLQPAAVKQFGSRVAAIEHAGSYSCRRIYGREEGPYSEHAKANAFDIIGFRLKDGTQISVLRDWNSDGTKGRFLRQVRDGACRIFATTLSPDYNAAHADHLHLDQAERGKMSIGVCR